MTLLGPPQDLLELSRALAADPELVQDAGGNTSVKDGARMWVKASGARLADVTSSEGFVAVDLDELGRLREAGTFDDVSSAVLAAKEGERPSIETWLHAALPHPVVAHVHSTTAVAVTLGADPQGVLAQVFDARGWRWAAVPYRRPGTPLAQAVTALGEPAPDVVVLGNHGIVVGGQDTAATGDLATEVHSVLRDALGVTAGVDAGVLDHRPPAPAGYRWSAEPRHALLAQARAVAQLRAGAWSPDQVVFLGPSSRLLEPPVDGQPVAVLPGAGVLLADGARPSVLALVDFLADVAKVLSGDVVNALRTADEDELLGWDAEHHRQALSLAREAALRDRGGA